MTKPSPSMCTNCGVLEPTKAGRCEACYQYLRKHDEERPDYLIHAAFLRKYPMLRLVSELQVLDTYL